MNIYTQLLDTSVRMAVAKVGGELFTSHRSDDQSFYIPSPKEDYVSAAWRSAAI